MKKLSFIIFLISILLLSCNNSVDKKDIISDLNVENKDSIKSELKLQEFIYVDQDSVLHLKLKCGLPRRIEFAEFEMTKSHYVKRITFANVNSYLLDRCCPVCIGDDEFKIIKEVVDSCYTQMFINKNKYDF